MTTPVLTINEIRERRRVRIEALISRVRGKTFPSGYVRAMQREKDNLTLER